MADRYAYLPFIGLFIMICWGVADWSEQRHISPTWLASVSVAVLLALTVTARVQLDHWTDNITLWSHTLQVTESNYIAENSLAVSLEDAGRPDEAIAHFRAAVAIRPEDAASNLNMAEYDRRHGNLIACIERCKRSSSHDAVGRRKGRSLLQDGFGLSRHSETQHKSGSASNKAQKIQNGQ